MPGPNTQNQYSQQAVPLDGGLDLINPKITLQAGTLSACLNFERTDRVGYSRIMGLERFDGGMSPSLSYTNLVYLIHDTNLVPADPRTEIFRVLEDTITNGPVLGCIVDATATKTLVAITNFDEWRLIQKAVNAPGSATIAVKDSGNLTVTDIQSFNSNFPNDNAQQLALQHNTFFAAMRNLVTDPGNSDKPVIGLHGFKDQVYAVKDYNTVHFTSGGTTQIFPNDELLLTTEGSDENRFRVYDIQLLSGTWAGGDAAGFFLIDTGDTVIAPGNYDIIRPNATRIINQATLDNTTTEDAWFAGMYRSASYDQAQDLSLDEGWNHVELGYQMGFDAGQSNGPFRISRRGNFSSFDTDVISSSDFGTVGSVTDSDSGGPVAGDSWTLVNASTVPEALQDESGTSKFVQVNMNDTVAPNLYEPADIYISNFASFSGFSTGTSINVKGVQVDVNVRGFPQNDGYRQMTLNIQPVTADTTILDGTSPKTLTIPVNQNPPSQQTVQSLTFGGPTDLWGLDADTMKAAMDSGFGFKVQPYIQFIDNLRSGRIDVLMVKVTVYYTATVTHYYFWNGSDDVTADITNYFHADDGTAGDWSTNDASGSLQVTNIQAVGSAPRAYITDNDQIRTDAGGAGLLIATVNGDMSFNGLDTLADIEEAGSRYQFITENFFADKDFEGMYGVSGAGRAFSWDGSYFTHIYTQADDAKDIPRHITAHQFHLVLGYEAGANLLSVAGNPFDYSGVNGAVEIDTGDPVHGYSRMDGTTLGIFGKKTVQGLVGTSPDNFSLTILSPYEGAIEYCVLDVGGKTVFMSYRGISVFDQTAAYGDFAGQRLSYLVSPFLIPRIQGLVPPIDSVATSNGLIVAVPCRTKNQVRFFFKDGYILTMTLAGSDQTPVFTIQAYQLMDDVGLFAGYFVPRAESSFVDSTGAERIHLAPYSKWVDVDAYHVYEAERSWTFDGSGIPAYFVTNENFYGGIFDFDNQRKLRLHGLSYGYAPLTVHYEADYGANDDTIQTAKESPNISLPRSPATTLSAELQPVTTITNPAKRGRSFSMRFMSYNLTTQDDTVKDPVYADVSPPFVIQAMMPQFTENKADV